MIQMPQSRFALPLLLLSLGFPALAAGSQVSQVSDTPADYAYALPLKVSGKQGVVGLPVPAVVYLKASTATLDDLRVFDAHGVVQPFALHRPPPEQPSRRASLVADIFPIASGKAATGNALPDLEIQTRADGSVASVELRSAKTQVAQAGDKPALSGLILDFGAHPQGSDGKGDKDDKGPVARIDALRFAAPTGKTNYSAEVWLETSNDLRTWEILAAAELSWLANGSGQTLASDRLEFSPQSFRYARLTWRRGEPVEFPQIQAETVARQSVEPERETLWLTPVDGKQAGELIYPAGIALPVEQISLNLSEANIVYPVTLGEYVERPGRRPGKASERVFRAKASATFYQITQNEQTRRSGPLNIAVTHQQDWVLRSQNPALNVHPELGLSWQAATLVFLAGGTPPYTLSFGRADATPASQPLGQVAPGFTTRELAGLEQAQIGELQVLRAETDTGSAAAEAGRSAQKRAFVLWGVLILGVVVLAGMARRLIRQMNAGEGKGTGAAD
jgi:hypothetical protein